MMDHFSVDTNNLFLGGSSDGGTACYLLAMKSIRPRIKGFVIGSGFPGILQQLGVVFDPAVCRQYSWYIIHTGKDRLYPLDQVQKYVAAMKRAGASVVFKQYPDLPHGLDYAEQEKPLILNWMKK
jgi:acetyl esterase/lipase